MILVFTLKLNSNISLKVLNIDAREKIMKVKEETIVVYFSISLYSLLAFILKIKENHFNRSKSKKIH